MFSIAYFYVVDSRKLSLLHPHWLLSCVECFILSNKCNMEKYYLSPFTCISKRKNKLSHLAEIHIENKKTYDLSVKEKTCSDTSKNGTEDFIKDCFNGGIAIGKRDGTQLWIQPDSWGLQQRSRMRGLVGGKLPRGDLWGRRIPAKLA